MPFSPRPGQRSTSAEGAARPSFMRSSSGRRPAAWRLRPAAGRVGGRGRSVESEIVMFECLGCWPACCALGDLPHRVRGGGHGQSVPSAWLMALITAGGEPIAPASPQPFTPSGLCGRLGFGLRREMRHVVGARHRVVHVAPVSSWPLGVVDRALQHRLADALHQAAVHLALDDHRVDRCCRSRRPR